MARVLDVALCAMWSEAMLGSVSARRRRDDGPPSPAPPAGPGGPRQGKVDRGAQTTGAVSRYVQSPILNSLFHC